MADRYRVTHVPHYIGGRLVHPDRGDESIVTLPEGVKAGRWLELVEDVMNVVSTVLNLYKVIHSPPGNYLVVRAADGAPASPLFKKADGHAKQRAEEEAIRLEHGGTPLVTLGELLDDHPDA